MGSEQRNAFLAIVLSGLVLFGWQYYFAPPKSAPAPIEATSNVGPVKTMENQAVDPAVGPIEPLMVTEDYTLTANDFSVTFDQNLTLKNVQNPQAALKFVDIVGLEKSMKIEFDVGQGFVPLYFTRTDSNTFLNSANNITTKISFSDKGVVQFNLSSTTPFKYRFTYLSDVKKLENGQERVFAYYTDELNRHIVGEEENGDRAIKWAGIDFNYHLFSTYFEKAPSLIYQTSANKTFSMYSTKAETELAYNIVFVKKEYNDLAGLGHNLSNSVDFGIWGFFAVWILKGLQFFYTFIPNYGVSIILLTLLIRIITFPLQYKSFVSMKKLQLVQPELTKLREKFKDDPQRMQKESMELFKKSGANPIGGCLPLLLQMPVFFAFYKVLHAAVELVDAPFLLWLQDLSNKDPYYVLPVLMTGAMFLQQKLTPNTISDPVQKKVMMFMPLIFGVIMKDLPAGLSLYIFVSTLFGIIQQVMVFNSKSTNTPVVV